MIPRDPKVDAEVLILVLASQSGESESFGKLYDRFVDPIFRYMHYRVGTDDAEDLTELTFLKTWENIKKFNPKSGNFSSWIFRIAHNIVVDHYRAHRQELPLTEDIQDRREEAATQDRAHRRLDQEILGKAMQKLKDHYRQVVILKYINDFSNEEC